MRDANWDEIFHRREESEAPPRDDALNSYIPWEDWLTLLITMIVFLSVVHSVDSARWVSDMPSLYPLGLAGLLAGYLLSRVKWSQLLLHPISLFIGATLVYLQLIAIIPGHSPYVRTEALVGRMHEWWSAATQNGVSSDSLPFIVLTLVLLWLGTYFSSWAIFRWHNPWFGLIPGGTALMWNISFIPGQFSYSFVVFVFGAVLLVMRLHVSHRETEWERDGVLYPEFISLSVLHATFWVTVALLVVAWAIPLASRSETASERWSDFTSPYTRRLEPLGRLFVSVRAKKPIEIHNLRDVLALQGEIKLNGRDAVEVNLKLPPDVAPYVAAYLRAQSFDEYTSNGWKVNVQGDLPLDSDERTDVPKEAAPGTRREITIKVKVEGNNNSVLYSLGQPVSSNEHAEARIGGDPADVSSLKPRDHLRNGDVYSVTGSVNVASVQQLRAAGTDYPSWVIDEYLQLPVNLPPRVGAKAREATADAPTPYDKAAAIENYLRTFPIDYNVPKAPPGRDSVDFFLFEARRGYFDYHASAMVVMLRTLGVPARVAVGYIVNPAQRVADGDSFKLTERDAFAWPELYFPGIGWVEFNPTLSEPLIPRPGQAPAVPGEASSRGTTDPLDFKQFDGPPLPEVPSGAAPVAGTGGSGTWPTLLALAIASGIVLTGATGAKFGWEFAVRGLPRTAQLWRKTQRLARWAGAGGPASETPREFATRLDREVPGADAVSYLASAYERTTFGRKPLPDDEKERLESSWRTVRNRLVFRILRRK